MASASPPAITVQRGAACLLSSPGTFSLSGGCHQALERGWCGWRIWTWVGEVVWPAPCCQSHSSLGIVDETCQRLWPLSHREHRGARLFLTTHSENTKWLNFQWKIKNKEECIQEVEKWTCWVIFCGIKLFKTDSLLAVSHSLLIHKTVEMKHFGFAEIKDFGNFPC